jgi:hypothetical protein
MATVNARWHVRHPMPRNATLDQRVKWHLAHVVMCGCREIPKTVIAELRARGIRIPKPRRD